MAHARAWDISFFATQEDTIMATSSDEVVLGSPAPDFRLRGTDGEYYSYKDVAGERGTVIVFICNHCPYVKAVIDRLVRDAHELSKHEIRFAAICSNDAVAYPADSFENMQVFATAHALPFPYLHDEDQSVAQAYKAVCTPDFFGYDARQRLRYHGRLDEGRTAPLPPAAPRELLEAMRSVAATGVAPAEQRPSMGCSIKWKPDL
jgi:peroxiredoxin